jgi:hypothetical protein
VGTQEQSLSEKISIEPGNRFVISIFHTSAKIEMSRAALK